MALTFILGWLWNSVCAGGPSSDFSTKNRIPASNLCEDGAGHAEKPGRKPRVIGDIEIDKPLHGPLITPESPCLASHLACKLSGGAGHLAHR